MSSNGLLHSVTCKASKAWLHPPWMRLPDLVLDEPNTALAASSHVDQEFQSQFVATKLSMVCPGTAELMWGRI
jgi:hypothetical protein